MWRRLPGTEGPRCHPLPCPSHLVCKGKPPGEVPFPAPAPRRGSRQRSPGVRALESDSYPVWQGQQWVLELPPQGSEGPPRVLPQLPNPESASYASGRRCTQIQAWHRSGFAGRRRCSLETQLKLAQISGSGRRETHPRFSGAQSLRGGWRLHGRVQVGSRGAFCVQLVGTVG